jgi:hypothetical protein
MGCGRSRPFRSPSAPNSPAVILHFSLSSILQQCCTVELSWTTPCGCGIACVAKADPISKSSETIVTSPSPTEPREWQTWLDWPLSVETVFEAGAICHTRGIFSLIRVRHRGYASCTSPRDSILILARCATFSTSLPRLSSGYLSHLRT